MIPIHKKLKGQGVLTDIGLLHHCDACCNGDDPSCTGWVLPSPPDYDAARAREMRERHIPVGEGYKTSSPPEAEEDE